MINIYQIVCQVNQKSYVGITSRSIEKRWHDHVENAISKNIYTPFYCAIRKHGSDAFIITLLETCDLWEEACIAEKRLIAELQSHITQHGYNATLGGDGLTGYTFTTEQRERLSVSHRNSPHVKRYAVCQIDANGNVIAHYRTVEEATIATGIKHICLVLKGKRNSAGGYFWCCPNELETFLHGLSSRPAPFKTFKVEQLTLDGKHVRTFPTINAAQIETGIKHIYEASSGQLISAGGFLWRRH